MSHAPNGPGPRTPLRYHRRTAICGGLLTAIIGVLFVCAVALSDYPLGTADLLRVIVTGGTRVENAVVWQAQIPRALTVVLVGAALGVSGALTQTLTRNPLATPDMLGITGGASVGAVLAMSFAGRTPGAASVPIPAAALIGALVATAVMYVVAWRRSVQPFRLVLVGIALTWAAQATVGLLLIRSSVTDAARAQQWIVGSIDRSTWPIIWPLLTVVAVSAILVPTTTSRPLAVAVLGDQMAASLGLRLRPTYLWVLLVAVALAGFSVAAAGPIAFIALLAPPIGMALAGSATPPPLIAGGVGSALVLAADLATRLILPDGMPVGVLTAGIGGVGLIWVVLRQMRRRSL